VIKVTVEIVPFGDTSRTRKIWEIEVSNIRTDKNDIADYNVCLLDHDAKLVEYYKVCCHPREKGLARLLKRVFGKIKKE
jgi:hypothetical protein